MLMAEAFSSLLKAWDQGNVSTVPLTLIVDSAIVSLYQVLVRTLIAQNANGSWGPSNSREVTAYATLTIFKASALPFAASICGPIDSAIAAAHKFLLGTEETAPSYLWVEKVTYGSVILAKSYVLAALNVSFKVQPSLSSKVASLATIPSVEVEHLSQTCFGSPLFGPKEAWKLQAAFIEGCLLRPYLQRLADDLVPGIKDETAFEVIPFIWTAYSYVEKQLLSISSLRENIGVSLLEYINDKFFLKPSTHTRLDNGSSKNEKLATTVNDSPKPDPTTIFDGYSNHEHTPIVNGNSNFEEPMLLQSFGNMTEPELSGWAVQK